MSQWRERANYRRDMRQTKLYQIRPPSHSSKDTRRWCRGVEGREHTPACVPHKSIRTWRNLECSVCHKVLDSYCPAHFMSPLNDERKPDWVVD
jgi:hypothetical protein